jgi:hypothetical protein
MPERENATGQEQSILPEAQKGASQNPKQISEAKATGETKCQQCQQKN